MQQNYIRFTHCWIIKELESPASSQDEVMCSHRRSQLLKHTANKLGLVCFWRKPILLATKWTSSSPSTWSAHFNPMLSQSKAQPVPILLNLTHTLHKPVSPHILPHQSALPKAFISICMVKLSFRRLMELLNDKLILAIYLAKLFNDCKTASLMGNWLGSWWAWNNCCLVVGCLVEWQNCLLPCCLNMLFTGLLKQREVLRWSLNRL